MNEENQTNEQNEQELPDQAIHQGTQMATNAAKKQINHQMQAQKAKLAAQMAKIAAWVAAHIVPILIVVAIIIVLVVVGIVLFALFDNYIDEDTSETIDEVTYQVIDEYCTLDDTGIRFDKEGFLKSITPELAKNGIDLNGLGFGDDQNSLSDYGSLFENISTDSQAAQYLYKFISASLAGEFPYIPGSDEETQGIIKIKRKFGENEKAKDLTYIGHQQLLDMIKDDDTKSEEELRELKEKSLNYFSLDESWNLCITKPYTRIVKLNGVVQSSEYRVTEVKIPYKSMVSQYTVPFLFLIDLQLITNNANYVEAVSKLMKEQSEIELTIFDSITTDTNTYNYKATRHSKSKPEDVTPPGGWEVSAGIAEPVGFNYSTSEVDRLEETLVQTDSIKANVTKAKTWNIEQETEYVVEVTREYPYTEEGTQNDLDDEDEPDGEGGWDTDRTEYWYEEIKEEKWTKSAGTKTSFNPSEFLGLWMNETGTYVQGAPYIPTKSGGKIVEYKTLNSFQPDRPVINIITSTLELYGLLENSEKTQTHAEMMREIIHLYLSGEEIPDAFGLKFIELFDPKEFIETNWNLLGSGFWWPLDNTSYTTITSPFGPRNTGIAGASKKHQGIDIAVPIGSKVIASADGTVEAAGYSSSMGFFVKINHGNGIKTVYMHNSEVLVFAGQKVKRGDVISLSGNTGVSSGPHLHFGVEVNGENVDPLTYVNPSNPRPEGGVMVDASSVEEWRPYIYDVFAELGYQATEEKVTRILKQIQTESGGNQFIMQGIIDSNSGKPITMGDGTCPWCPSQTGGSCRNTNIGHGLLQFIPTTFNSCMLPGHTNIYSGYDQICALVANAETKNGGSYTHIGNGTGWGPK